MNWKNINPKVGILTFHESDNYGARWQAYALLKIVNEKAYGEIINYHSQALAKKKPQNLSFLKKVIALVFKLNKHIKFNPLQKNI